MSSDDSPLKARIDDYLKKYSSTEKFLQKAGVGDITWSQKQAWAIVLDNSTLLITLSNLPQPNKKGITANEVIERFGCSYDKSNNLKNLQNLISLGLAEASINSDGRSTYKMSDLGEDLYIHAGYMFAPRKDIQDSLLKSQEENMKLQVELQRKDNIISSQTEDYAELVELIRSARTLEDLRLQVKVLGGTKS